MAEDNSNSSDYTYVDDELEPEGSNWWWADHLPELVWTGIWMFLFLVSLVSNLVRNIFKQLVQGWRSKNASVAHW